MATTTLDEKKLKAMLKSAVSEALYEQRELVRMVVEETMEDLGMAYAIRQGKTGKRVTKAEVFNILEPRKK